MAGLYSKIKENKFTRDISPHIADAILHIVEELTNGPRNANTVVTILIRVLTIFTFFLSVYPLKKK